MRVRQLDNAYKNRQEKVPITFIFLLSTHLPPPFAYIFFIICVFFISCVYFQKERKFYTRLCLCVCVCVFRIFWKTAKLQFAMQSQQKQQLRSHACKLPYNFEKKNLKFPTANTAENFIRQEGNAEEDC